jgi:hypothetical protein
MKHSYVHSFQFDSHCVPVGKHCNWQCNLLWRNERRPISPWAYYVRGRRLFNTRPRAFSMFVGDPVVTLTTTLTVTWPGLFCLSGVGELRSIAPRRTRAGTGRGEDVTGLAGWQRSTPDKGVDTIAYKRLGSHTRKWEGVRQPRRYPKPLEAWIELREFSHCTPGLDPGKRGSSCSPQQPDRLCDLHSLLSNVYRSTFLGDKAVGARSRSLAY